ncbi:hypothetical protein QUB47_29040 [Microcoleus sp. AT9_B5]
MGKRLSRPIAAYLRYIEGIKRERQLGSGLMGRSLYLKKQVQKVALAHVFLGAIQRVKPDIDRDRDRTKRPSRFRRRQV